MGTNYYVQTGPLCPHCGRGPVELHLGKSSSGWVFGLHVYPDMGINTLADWIEYWRDKHIMDECGASISPEDMIRFITERSFGDRTHAPYGYSSWDEFHSRNYSEDGPNNLVRHRVDGTHCIAHGEGTYDYIVGAFS